MAALETKKVELRQLATARLRNPNKIVEAIHRKALLLLATSHTIGANSRFQTILATSNCPQELDMLQIKQLDNHTNNLARFPPRYLMFINYQL